MKYLYITFSMVLFFTKVSTQTSLNLDFENVAKDGNYALGWSSTGSHVAFLDDKVKKHGENSIRLELASNSDERNWSYLTNSVNLASYTGKFILLRGYIKTENLTGTAGLYMHQQGGSHFKLETINLDNMEGRRISGTNDWTPILLRMPFPSDLYQIEFGVYIEGKGKVWIDDLKLLVDDKLYLFADKRNPNSQEQYPKDKTKKDDENQENSPYYKKKANEMMEKRNAETEAKRAKSTKN